MFSKRSKSSRETNQQGPRNCVQRVLMLATTTIALLLIAARTPPLREQAVATATGTESDHVDLAVVYNTVRANGVPGASRLLEASWLRTEFENATTDVQNNLQLGAGIVFRIR